MHSGFEGLKVVIAGGFRGMGLELARMLLDARAKVFVIGRSESGQQAAREELASTSDTKDLELFSTDLESPDGVRSAYERVREWGNGQLDQLAVFVGSGKTPQGHSFPLQHWQKVFHTNFFTPLEIVQTFLPLIEESRKHPCIILTAAIAGVERVRAPMTYSLAKTSLLAYVSHLAEALAPKGIRVLSVSPGNVLYKGGRWEEIISERPEEIERFIRSEVGMQRFGTPKELAWVYFTNMSPCNSFSTGQNIICDGLQVSRIF